MVFTDGRLSGIGSNIYHGVRNSVSGYLNSGMHRAGMEGLRTSFGLSSTNALGFKPGWMGRFGGSWAVQGAIDGYIDDGARGAVKGGVKGAAQGYAWRAGGHLLKTGGAGMVAVAGAGVAVAGVGAMFIAGGAADGQSTFRHAIFRKEVTAHSAKRARLEMGSPLQDWTGTGASMRQRSINAMRESKITARSALGMEAARCYMPYFR